MGRLAEWLLRRQWRRLGWRGVLLGALACLVAVVVLIAKALFNVHLAAGVAVAVIGAAGIGFAAMFGRALWLTVVSAEAMAAEQHLERLDQRRADRAAREALPPPQRAKAELRHLGSVLGSGLRSVGRGAKATGHVLGEAASATADDIRADVRAERAVRISREQIEEQRERDRVHRARQRGLLPPKTR